MFSLSAVLIIPNLSCSLLAYPPAKTASSTDELSYTVLIFILQEKKKNNPERMDPLLQTVHHTETHGLSEVLSLPRRHYLYPQIVPPANTVLFSTASLETMTETLIPWDGQQKRVIPGSLLTRATNLKSNSLVRVNLYSNTRTSCRDGLSPSILCRQADLWSYLVPVQLSVHLHFFTFITKSENKQDISPHRIRMKN